MKLSGNINGNFTGLKQKFNEAKYCSISESLLLLETESRDVDKSLEYMVDFDYIRILVTQMMSHWKKYGNIQGF